MAVKGDANASTAGARTAVKEKQEEAVDLRAMEEAAGEAAVAEEAAAQISKRVTSTTASELPMEPKVEVPPEAEPWRMKQDRRLRERLEGFLAAQEAAPTRRAGAVEAGEVTVGAYVGMDLLAYSPIQGIGPPPYEPHKIIQGGESAVIWALLFVNPVVSIPSGFAVPPTVQLGGRRFRVRCEQMNLTNVTNGPDFTFVGTFSSPASVFTWIPFVFTAADPGENPWLIEANITADVTDLAQPWAAFATWHFDIESDPGGIPGIPSVPAELQHDIPMRYLIYRG